MSLTTPASGLPEGFTVRHDLKPGDLGMIVHLHGTIYAREYCFDSTFEAYVAAPLADFVRARTNRDCVWIVERADEMVGCIAIVGVSDDTAQLRWFLVAPSARGVGLGRYLLSEAISFCQRRGYRSVFLWTVQALTTATSLYQAAGFCKAEEKPGKQWGVEVIEEKYVLRIETERVMSCS